MFLWFSLRLWMPLHWGFSFVPELALFIKFRSCDALVAAAAAKLMFSATRASPLLMLVNFSETTGKNAVLNT